MPPELVGLCFNSLCPSHVKASYRAPPRCNNCWREGHHAVSCPAPSVLPSLGENVRVRHPG